MAEFEYKYSGNDERQAKIAEAEDKGQVMLHDNFDPDWKRGDEPSGILIFTDYPPASPAIPPSRDPLAEIDQLKIEIQQLRDTISK